MLKTRLHSTRAKRKRCYDVTLSRQEGSMMRHLASAQYWDLPASGDTGRLFWRLAGRSVRTGLAIVHWTGCINTIKRNFSAIWIVNLTFTQFCAHCIWLTWFLFFGFAKNIILTIFIHLIWLIGISWSWVQVYIKSLVSLCFHKLVLVETGLSVHQKSCYSFIIWDELKLSLSVHKIRFHQFNSATGSLLKDQNY